MIQTKIIVFIYILFNAKAQEYEIVQKCCEEHEHVENKHCMPSNESGIEPLVFNASRLIVGLPQCGPRDQWPIYHYDNSQDTLQLLPNGQLRHYTFSSEHDDFQDADEEESDGRRFHDYLPGTYCIDKVVLRNRVLEAQLAIVCTPAVSAWNGTDFLMRRIIDPVFHTINIVCFLSVAIVYFVMPQLRDLVGNILSTIAASLIASQAADLVRIFTELSNHVSLLFADVAVYMTLLAAFSWLNVMGFYIWKIFRSRNVFLRVSDGRKYCYYSTYVWSITVTMTALALFAHYMLDITNPKVKTRISFADEALGLLGIAVFFTPIAFTILVNIFFYLNTGQAINRLPTYGRIHYKMKYSYEMFIKIFLVMSVVWLFLLLSWLRYDALIYCHIVINALQGPLFFYITVYSQRKVTFLLRQAFGIDCCLCPCCRPGDPSEGAEWGEEMMTMNKSSY